MSGRNDRFYRHREHRGLAAAIALVALLMQLLAPYLPMPAMGGLTSWEVATLDLCAPGGDRDGQLPSDGRHDCAVCTVAQQASGTMAPADMVVAFNLAYLRLERDISSDPQISTLSAHVFSSRAPPLTT